MMGGVSMIERFWSLHSWLAKIGFCFHFFFEVTKAMVPSRRPLGDVAYGAHIVCGWRVDGYHKASSYK